MEITTFALKGHTCKAFIKANADIDAFLLWQPGFRSRRIFEQNGLIVDMLVWGSVAQGTKAMHRLMSELADSPVHAMIDQRTVSWNITAVQHRLENTK